MAIIWEYGKVTHVPVIFMKVVGWKATRELFVEALGGYFSIGGKRGFWKNISKTHKK